ncbi:type II toxin-antitoxin system RelE/ParE family toxin [Acidisphaera sp. S103]|uniref:type II toxin-antitoxin system RelE/ParE family toxin n=1 Tax=Acidisphaera sp. S103 TaxID=1747223 RepID=UPI00131E1EDE|nr:type II toxin-antitoxin system RelE/ParE family toxin [Acidisphaera sp. S103]
MHTVCETHSFQRAAKDAGMSTDEITDLINYLAVNPMAGDEMAGTGGCRKLRVAGRGKGKSGGYRTITFYSGQMMPVFLITVFSKGEKANLTKAECNQLALLTQTIVSEYKKRIVKVSATQ